MQGRKEEGKTMVSMETKLNKQPPFLLGLLRCIRSLYCTVCLFKRNVFSFKLPLLHVIVMGLYVKTSLQACLELRWLTLRLKG